MWVGGDANVFEQYKPVLDAIGDQVVRVGDIGAGLVAKLVHNSAGYMIQAALAEAFTLGVKAGVEPLALWQAVRQGAIGRQRTFDRLADHFLSANFDPPAFALRLAHKDVSLATELGREHDVPMRVANLALDELTEALNRGWGQRDSRVAMLLQEERAGVEIQVDPALLRQTFEAEAHPG
jgi:3-hydroxyisobutyrate dehydrogenase-like beta-hydroxyacid dehydrogenase